MKKILGIMLCIISIFSFVSCIYYERSIDTDISNYDEKILEVGYAVEFMPAIDSLEDYTSVSYSHQCVPDFIGCFESIVLFVQYDACIYKAQKAKICSKYSFLTETKLSSDKEEYELILPSFEYKTYSISIVDKGLGWENPSLQSFGMVGFDDERSIVAYCYFYNVDLDYIAKTDEDLNVITQAFMDTYFYWNDIED